MTREEAKSELMQLYGSLSEEKKQALDVLMAIPSAESKTGQWITEDMFDGDVAYRCSECNELFWIEDGTPKDNGYDFCPKCGARMVEPTCDTCEYNTAAFMPCNACEDKSEYKPKER